MIHGDFLRESGYLAAQEALRNSTYDAIFAASDHMALARCLLPEQRHQGARRHGITALTTHSSPNSSIAAHHVRQPMQDIGSIAMETVLRILEHHESRFQKIIFYAASDQAVVRCTHA